MNARKNSSIRALERRASSGELKSTFQLYEYYREGKYVEKDSEKANYYAESALSLFDSGELTIESMKMVSFRGFESETIHFNDKDSGKLTAIVGVNGAGKTAILDALQKGMSWLAKRVSTQGGTGDLIEESDIKISSEYTSVIVRFSISCGTTFELEMSRAIEGSNTSRKNSLTEINLLADMYKLASDKNSGFGLPILACYSVERATEIKSKDIGQFGQISNWTRSSKVSGLKGSLNGAADFKLFFSWFKELDDIKNANTSRELELLVSKVKKAFDERVNDDPDAAKDESGEALLTLKSQLESLRSGLGEDGKLKAEKILSTVCDAIYAFLPGVGNLRIQREPTLDMRIDKNGTNLSVLQLSQGEKSMLALVADISRRLVLLNPGHSSPLEGGGVVLIDEIDLHLHPEWQQQIIPKLTSTFPNIQFIVTTHSPQVLTTVDSESIRVLDNGKIYSAPHGTKGADSARLLKRVLGVDPRPVDDENVRDLKEYRDLVYKDKWGEEEAVKLRRKLDAAFNGEEPELTELDLYIENREWEMGIEKDI
ncbi:retron Ec78 anti-phage system effector ATPase PtuA [Ketobacter sp.]|uniref:retron Ec78 anti-phage system effector ATPase PtuA n=1 Tax=Ketobacter sp. TaxID=2083498 RepID=UPI000F2AEAEC|nr:retron Ec78 anti-phage system effector ATPase PtuA [Ketobacter sp.]RLT94411.1 MAG: recombinase RecF [Ketobacter sp.]